MILIFDHRGWITHRSDTGTARTVGWRVITGHFWLCSNHLLGVIGVLLFLDSERPASRRNLLSRWRLLLKFLYFRPLILIFFQTLSNHLLARRLIFHRRIMRLWYILQRLINFRLLLHRKIVILIVSRTIIYSLFHVILCLCLHNLESTVFVEFVVLVFLLHLDLPPQLLLHLLIFLHHALILPETFSEYMTHAFEHLRCKLNGLSVLVDVAVEACFKGKTVHDAEFAP